MCKQTAAAAVSYYNSHTGKLAAVPKKSKGIPDDARVIE